MEVVPIKESKNSSAVEVLEVALKEVKAGNIQAVSICWVGKDNSIGGDISRGDSNFCMLASMENSLRHFKQLIFGDPV